MKSNPKIYARPVDGPRFSTLECVYYAVGTASIAVCWYCNVRFVQGYANGNANPVWGPGSWADYIRLMFVNPAASSAGWDYTIANVVLLPLWTIIDGRRRGVNHPWV
ncbi:MAG: Conserved rane protein of unknown function [Mycobacterium sp.]|nr:Conserved rane protein of unknown function [Mycobacterium sp.]